MITYSLLQHSEFRNQLASTSFELPLCLHPLTHSCKFQKYSLLAFPVFHDKFANTVSKHLLGLAQTCLEAAVKGLFLFITKERGEKICKISEDNDQVPNPRLPMAACPRAALDQPAPEEHLHDSEVQQTFLDDFTVWSTESNICYISGKYLAK